MILRIYSLAILLLLGLFSYAGNDNYPFGARAAGMGNAGVASSDVWSVFNNQAGLASLQNPQVGLHYENRFIVSELACNGGSIVYPTNGMGVFGLSISQFGYSQYSETKIGLAYAKQLGKIFAVGLQFDYLNTRFSEDYGNKGVPVAEIGVRATPTEDITIGAHVYNITRSKIADYNNERIPTLMRFGLGYKFTHKLYFAAEVEKDLNSKPSIRAGAEYVFLESLYFRAGYSSGPDKAHFGLGYVYKGIKADVSFTTHSQLGITPYVSLIYEFGTQKVKGSLL